MDHSINHFITRDLDLDNIDDVAIFRGVEEYLVRVWNGNVSAKSIMNAEKETLDRKGISKIKLVNDSPWLDDRCVIIEFCNESGIVNKYIKYNGCNDEIFLGERCVIATCLVENNAF